MVNFSAFLVYKGSIRRPRPGIHPMTTTIPELNPPSPVYDPSPANPFIEQPNTWNINDVADTRVLNYLRGKIDKLKFLLDHPLTGQPHDQHTIDRLVREIDRMTLLLNKAHYNYFILSWKLTITQCWHKWNLSSFRMRHTSNFVLSFILNSDVVGS